MKRRFNRIIFVLMALAMVLGTVNAQTGFYNLKAKDIDGQEFDFSALKGKKVMIVNTASKCGFTPQYEQLQELYEKHGDKDFVVLGFPANNFMGQEPGTLEEIKEFCSVKFGVTFPMMEKISVKGKDIHPVYQWLTEKEKNGVEDSKVKWNFQKYLINEKGELEKVYYSRTSPTDPQIINWIKN